jgi:S-adenosylmethionine-diacylgycerolhomoserine-N-methlytransferase
MPLISDLRVLYHLLAKPVRGADHAARLESFYGGQAEAYDDFRRRLLQGRAELYTSIPFPAGGVWVDLGGGTGSNLEPLADKIPHAGNVYVVDLCASLLEVARKRFAARGWSNVEAVEADATTFRPPQGTADVVTFSYALTMIPDWFAAVENALAMLKPGGHIGVVDFYVGRKYPADGLARHSWLTRSFWPVWFASDNVFPSADHLPYLQRHFETEQLVEQRAKVPYMPLMRVPYYRFVGLKR